MHRNLWAPWRMAYIKGLDAHAAEARAAGGEPRGDDNFLAGYWAHPELDREQLVVYRSERGLVLLNRFPYANGHLLVALGEPRGMLSEYDAASRAHFWQLMELAMALCTEVFQPQGLNAGLNIGRAAGAGLPQHVHGHVVPRWAGDTNFLSVLGEVRVIPDSLERSWEQYRAALPKVMAQS